MKKISKVNNIFRCIIRKIMKDDDVYAYQTKYWKKLNRKEKAAFNILFWDEVTTYDLNDIAYRFNRDVLYCPRFKTDDKSLNCPRFKKFMNDVNYFPQVRI